MKDAISKLPLQQLADDAVSTLRSLKELVSAPEIPVILKYAAEASKSAAGTAAVAEREAGPLVRSAGETAVAAQHTIERLDNLIVELQPRLLAVVTGFDRLLATADQRTGQISGDLHATLGEVRTLVAPRSALLLDLQTLLHNMAAASGSLRGFAEQVDRNPNAVLMGRSSR
jgi:paraquat-inducible protein B